MKVPPPTSAFEVLSAVGNNTRPTLSPLGRTDRQFLCDCDHYATATQEGRQAHAHSMAVLHSLASLSATEGGMTSA